MVARPRAFVLLALTVAAALVPPTATAQQPAKREPERTESDALVEQLLNSEGASEDDLGWVYSNRDEYSPSGLVGEPVPIEELPETGQGSPRKWDPRWRRFSVGNYIL